MNEFIATASISFIINTNDNINNVEIFAGEILQKLKVQTQYGNISFGVQNLKVQNTKDITVEINEIVNENKDSNKENIITEEQKEQEN